MLPTKSDTEDGSQDAQFNCLGFQGLGFRVQALGFGAPSWAISSGGSASRSLVLV